MTTTQDADWSRWFVPGVIPVTLLEIASERGLVPAELLTRAGIEVALEDLFESGLTFAQHAQLAQLVDAELHDPRLGFELGWRLPPTALGNLGYALLASATLAEALDLLQRFWHLVGRAALILVDSDGDISNVKVIVQSSIPEEEHATIKEITLVSMFRGLLALMPGSGEQAEVWFDFPEPPHGAYVRERLGRVHYDMPACQFRYPTRLLATELPMSNPVGLRAAVKWCESEEKMRGLADGRLTARLQADLRPSPNGYPSLEQVARRLGMAPRTLRRHLKREGTRFSSQLELARQRDAMRLLDNPKLAAHEVAAMLGYVDAANFTRAFRRWTGLTPTQYRKKRAVGKSR